MIDCDLHVSVVEVYRALVLLIGRCESELRGQSVLELFADERTRTSIRTALAARVQLTQISAAEMLDAAGSAVPVELNCAPRFDLRGRLVL